mmetsp:Transcript_24504/g.36712  ORF Transcript_24504/g.36712 Transcript_24504/m.36712 type:complete len:234 (-) Transcript_24504:806-1507(-)
MCMQHAGPRGGKFKNTKNDFIPQKIAEKQQKFSTAKMDRPPPAQLSLALDGIPCTIHPNRSSNRSNNAGNTYLIDYYAMRGVPDDGITACAQQQQQQQHQQLFMSRYDARALLDESTLAACEGSYEVIDESSQIREEEDTADADERQALHVERYRDLPGFFDEGLPPQDKETLEGKTEESASLENEAEGFEIHNAPKNLVLVSCLSLYVSLYLLALCAMCIVYSAVLGTTSRE